MATMMKADLALRRGGGDLQSKVEIGVMMQPGVSCDGGSNVGRGRRWRQTRRLCRQREEKAAMALRCFDEGVGGIGAR